MMWRMSMAIALCAWVLPALAADAPLPNRPIRMLVPYPAGGSLDLPGRAVGMKFSEATGQQLVLDNRGGKKVCVPFSSFSAR